MSDTAALLALWAAAVYRLAPRIGYLPMAVLVAALVFVVGQDVIALHTMAVF